MTSLSRARLRPALLAPAAALWVAAGGAAAQEESGDEVVLDAIVVTAPEGGAASGPGLARVERPELLGAWQGAGVETILNGIAGVTTESTPGDPAIAVNIRGLQGNGRVVVTIDGARQNFARSGHGPNGTFYADPEMLRAVSVTRGPAGAEAAAGAIGGTLALRTIEADDLMEPDEAEGGEMRLRYGTLTAQPTAHLAYARRFGAAADALIAFTRAAPSDYDAGDGYQVQAAGTDLSGLAKLSFAPRDGDRATLSWSKLDSEFETGSYEGVPRDNHMDTTNAVLDYALSGAGPVSGALTLFRTETEVSQRLLEDGLWPAGPARSYTTTTVGLRGEASGGFALGATDHELVLALDAFRDEVVTDDATAIGGSLTPSGDRDIASVLLQDTVTFGFGAQATLGLRYVNYRLESDDGSASGADLAPSLTLRQAIGGALSLYGTLAQAYRPPTLSESLVNGMHPEPADFYIRPNPDLKPEDMLSIELGATLSLADLASPGDALDAQVAVYRNDIKDYIGLVQRGTLFDPYFQYDNIDEVRIEGAEIEVAYDARAVFASVAGQVMKGTDRETDEQVSGIPPNRVTLTGGWRSPSQALELGARYNIVGAREDGTLSSQAWQTLDLFLTRRFGEVGTFGLSLNNVTNETYTQYLNTQPSPGFNALASLSILF